MKVSAFIKYYLSQAKWGLLCLISAYVTAEIFRQLGFFYASRIAGTLSETGDKSVMFHQALQFAGLMGFFLILRGLVNNQDNRIRSYYVPRLRIKIMRDLFKRAHEHSVLFFNEEMSGRIGAKIVRTVNSVFTLERQLIAPINSMVKIIIGCYFLIQIHIMMAVATLACVALFGCTVRFTTGNVLRCSKHANDLLSTSDGFFVDTLFNYSLVKNDGNIQNERRRYFQTLKPWVYAERKTYRAEVLMYVTQAFFRCATQFILLCLPVYYWTEQKISVADFVLAESLISYLTLFALDVSGKLARLLRSMGSIADGLEFIYRPVMVKDVKKPRPFIVKKGQIEFKNISFTYPNTYAKKKNKILFKNFNLRIKPKEKVGLVGASGSGKSSLVKLLERYYDVQKGQILIDGQNIAQTSQTMLRKQIAIIEQNPALFNRTIMENIRYGRLDATDEQVIKAAKKAYIHDFIMRLPQGYETKVGERGVILSGGQRQRIAIARAILKEAPILILDEATAALDSESEIFIQKSLAKIIQNKTVIAIAHRLSTLREMDYLLVMDKGEIVEQGTHASLLKQNGAYAKFYKLQAHKKMRKK